MQYLDCLKFSKKLDISEVILIEIDISENPFGDRFPVIHVSRTSGDENNDFQIGCNVQRENELYYALAYDSTEFILYKFTFISQSTFRFRNILSKIALKTFQLMVESLFLRLISKQSRELL